MEPHCPHCQSSLDPGNSSWRCVGCGLSYPALRGIPDLRTSEDTYLSNEADWEIARRLDESFDVVDFRGLLEIYFDLATEVTPAQRSSQITHILSAPGRASQWVQRLERREKAGVVLDLGCGSGSFLAAKAEDFGSCLGLDIAMRWLILARKRLDELGMESLRLICGCAENLPFPTSSISAIVAGDVIEHVEDQAATIAEAHRVLRPGGKIIMASPNRYSLAPEPHVGVWGVGFMPRRWMAGYVRFTSNRDFRSIHTLSVVEWTRLLRRSDFAISAIESPQLPDEDLENFRGLKRLLAQVYNGLSSYSLGQWIAQRVGPLFHILAQKSDQQPSPATPPHSTRRARQP